MRLTFGDAILYFIHKFIQNIFQTIFQYCITISILIQICSNLSFEKIYPHPSPLSQLISLNDCLIDDELDLDQCYVY